MKKIGRPKGSRSSTVPIKRKGAAPRAAVALSKGERQALEMVADEHFGGDMAEALRQGLYALALTNGPATARAIILREMVVRKQALANRDGGDNQ